MKILSQQRKLKDFISLSFLLFFSFLGEFSYFSSIIAEVDENLNHSPLEEPSVSPGFYQHYKGNYYEVLAMAKNSENLEDMVVYRPLYGDFKFWVRPASMFKEVVTVNGEVMPRFRFLGTNQSTLQIPRDLSALPPVKL